MSTLYIRKKPEWINFISTVKELDEFIEYRVTDNPIVLGDVALFTIPMKNRLLKLIEDNRGINLYSSSDVLDSVLMSRVSNVIKEKVTIRPDPSIEAYEASNKDFLSVALNLSNLSNTFKLRATGKSKRFISLIVNLSNGTSHKY